MSSKGIRTPQLVAKGDSCSWLRARGAPSPTPSLEPSQRASPDIHSVTPPLAMEDSALALLGVVSCSTPCSFPTRRHGQL